MPTAELAIPAAHPAYAGHFPGHPVLPGVVLLDYARRAIETACGRRCTGIAQAKFTSPSGPDDRLSLDFTPAGDAVRFDIRSGERRIASGRFTLAAAA